uniref:Uncharacterized protein n=1 Tax=Brassica campestris TaxID=3711 RepID=M4DW42_BRACM
MGSQSRGSSSHVQDSVSPHSSYHTSPSPLPAPTAPAPAATPAPAPTGPPGVMSVAELVRQPGRDHLPYLTEYPHGHGQTWFNRSGNGISAWINRMMYSALDSGHPTFTHFPVEKQHLWFRQFAEGVLRYIPRNLPMTFVSSEFSRNFVSSEFRRKFPTEFRGNMNFRGDISEDFIRRYVFRIALFRRHTDDFFPQYADVFL